MSRFSVEVFFVSQNRKTLQGNPSVLCFSKFLVANYFRDKKGENKYFSSNIFCLTVPKRLVDGPSGVSLISGIKKIMLKGVKHVFSSIFFSLAEPKNFAGEHFCAVF